MIDWVVVEIPDQTEFDDFYHLYTVRGRKDYYCPQVFIKTFMLISVLQQYSDHNQKAGDAVDYKYPKAVFVGCKMHDADRHSGKDCA